METRWSRRGDGSGARRTPFERWHISLRHLPVLTAALQELALDLRRRSLGRFSPVRTDWLGRPGTAQPRERWTAVPLPPPIIISSGAVKACLLDAEWDGVASADEKSLPLFQKVARDHPPDGDALHPLAAFAAPGRGSAVRTWHRYRSRDGMASARGVILVFPARWRPVSIGPTAPQGINCTWRFASGAGAARRGQYASGALFGTDVPSACGVGRHTFANARVG